MAFGDCHQKVKVCCTSRCLTPLHPNPQNITYRYNSHINHTVPSVAGFSTTAFRDQS